MNNCNFVKECIDSHKCDWRLSDDQNMIENMVFRPECFKEQINQIKIVIKKPSFGIYDSKGNNNAWWIIFSTNNKFIYYMSLLRINIETKFCLRILYKLSLWGQECLEKSLRYNPGQIRIIRNWLIIKKLIDNILLPIIIA